MPAATAGLRSSHVRAAITAASCLLFLLTFLVTRPPASPKIPLLSASLAPRNSTAMNYFSLWAMPAEGSAFFARSASAIKSLGDRMKCTPFEPHVTVIGAFGADQGLDEASVITRTKDLCSRLKPYDIRVKELSSGLSFFQCVYLKMEPSDDVVGVNREARSIMEMDENAAYMPHLSLVYGNLSEDEKNQVKSIVKAEYSDLLEEDASFHVDSLALYRTIPNDFSMSTWERLGVFPLGG